MTHSTDPTNADVLSWPTFFAEVDVRALALVCMAVWLHAADSLVVTTMLPSIVKEIGGQALVGWSVALYEIGSIVAGSASALLVLRFGLRGPMAIAATCFAFGCALSAFSPSMPLVLAGRLMQGVGGGGLVAMGFVAVSVLFPPRYTARALAAISALWGVSAFLGPLIGGLFVEFATWRWGFLFFAVQAIALALWIWNAAPKDIQNDPDGTGPVPLRRLGLLLASVLLIASAGINVTPLQTSALVIAGIVSFAAFLLWDGRAINNRLLPPAPFDPRNPAGATLSMVFMLSIATIAITAFGPLLMTAIHNAPALLVGYIVACSSIGWTITAVLVSGAPERYDPPLIAFGIILVVLSIPGFLYAVPNGPLWLIAVFAGIEGGGFGIAWTFILRRTSALASPSETQRIAGALPTIQRLGYALGAAYIGIVANAAGFLDMNTTSDAQTVARIVFWACIPPALLALPGLWGLVRTQEPENS